MPTSHVLLLLFFNTWCCLITRQAVIMQPVVDGLIVSASSTNQKTDTLYANLAPVPSKEFPTPRACQVLFNTVVHVIQEKNDELLVEIQNIFYDIDKQGKHLNYFWLPKKHCRYVDALSFEIRRTFPKPLSFKNHHWEDPRVAVLTLPWKSTQTNLTYSVGTRFVREPKYDTPTALGILFFDGESKSIIHDLLPKTHAIVEGSITKDQKRSAMINLIEQWIADAQQKNAYIPYVWGGASYTGIQQSYPCSGFDCSSLIMRAAQIVGIPLACKTSAMMEQCLQPFCEHDTLKIGDIIWRPGHVVIISNVENNEIIQARGNESGYGYSFITRINNHFKRTNKISDLITQHHAHKPIIELKKNGKPYMRYDDFKLLKLPT